jgi:hypothetical protein
MKTINTFILTLGALFFLLTACGESNAQYPEYGNSGYAEQTSYQQDFTGNGNEQGNDNSYATSTSMNQQVPSNGDFVRISDPNENAFSIMMPKGWKAQVGLQRPGGQVRPVSQAVSPDGSSRIFMGDPNIPTFFNPNLPYASYVQSQPMCAVSPVMQAADFSKQYLQRNYGQQGNLQMGQTRKEPSLEQKSMQKAREKGFSPKIEVVSTLFSFQSNGQLIKGELITSIIATNEFWLADVGGFTTSRNNLSEMQAIVRKVGDSYETNPQWEQREKMRQQQQMAAQHQRNMQRSQQSFNAHQQRMQMRQQAFNAHQQNMQSMSQVQDMQHNSWMNQQNMRDQGHQNYMNYLRDENTITNGNYQSQVQSGYNYYWVDPNTNEYIGTQYNENPDPTRFQMWKKKN